MIPTFWRTMMTGLFILLMGTGGTGMADAGRTEPGTVSEEVRMPSDAGVTLAGTLLVPQASGSASLPVAILISGTGTDIRGSRFNARLSAQLLAEGIATLDYDKRGLGQSTGEFVDTIPVMERDIEAVIAYLRTRPDIDGSRIALIGQSQGGVAAPAVASRDPGIAAVVMLSGPVGPRGDLFLRSLRANLHDSGRADAIVDHIVEATSQWMEARSRAAPEAEIASLRAAVVEGFVEAGFAPPQADGAVGAMDTPVLLSMFEVASDQALAMLGQPVLAIYGSLDTAVDRSIADAQAALRDNADALVVAIPGVGHTFRRSDRDRMTDEPLSDVPAAPWVGELVSYWLRDRLGRSDSQSPDNR